MDELEDIMTILAIAILADSRVTGEEVNVFKRVLSQIKLSNSDIKLPSETAAIKWFNHYRLDITAIVFGPQSAFENRLNTLLDGLAPHIDPEALIHALQMIAISDGEVHETETQLITYIKQRWQMG